MRRTYSPPRLDSQIPLAQTMLTNRPHLSGLTPDGLRCQFNLKPDTARKLLEFKAEAGKLTANQQDWLDRLTRLGIPAIVARSVDDAIAFLRQCGAPFIDWTPFPQSLPPAARAATVTHKMKKFRRFE